MYKVFIILLVAVIAVGCSVTPPQSTSQLTRLDSYAAVALKRDNTTVYLASDKSLTLKNGDILLKSVSLETEAEFEVARAEIFIEGAARIAKASLDASNQEMSEFLSYFTGIITGAKKGSIDDYFNEGKSQDEDSIINEMALPVRRLIKNLNPVSLTVSGKVLILDRRGNKYYIFINGEDYRVDAGSFNVLKLFCIMRHNYGVIAEKATKKSDRNSAQRNVENMTNSISEIIAGLEKQ